MSDADAVQQAAEQNVLKNKAHDQFWGLLFLKQSDQGKYGHLLWEFRQAYANKQHDLYPEDLTNMFEVMKTVNVKKELFPNGGKHLLKSHHFHKQGPQQFIITTLCCCVIVLVMLFQEGYKLLSLYSENHAR